jgi:hypothetical protein
VAATPFALRVEVVSQAAYDSHVELTLAQSMAGGAGRRFVSLAASREYFGGTPRTWTFAMPDLTTLAGFDAAAALAAGEFDWSLSLSSAPAGFSPLTAPDGFVVRTASATGRGP